MKYVSILSALLVACLLASPALATYNCKAAQNQSQGDDTGCTIGLQNRNCSDLQDRNCGNCGHACINNATQNRNGPNDGTRNCAFQNQNCERTKWNATSSGRPACNGTSQNQNCERDIGNAKCPRSDVLGNQCGNQKNSNPDGNPDGDRDGNRDRDRDRDGSCQD